MRQTRLTRLTRLAPVQRIALVVEDVRRWLGERLGIEQAESVKQVEKISPVVKETPGQKLRRVLEQNQQQQRRSRGMSI